MSTKWSAELLGGKKPDFASLLKNESTVILLRGKNVFGDMIYCYLKVTFAQIEKLQEALAGTDRFNISDFGSVIAAGKGEPTAEVKSEVAEIYPMFDEPKPVVVPGRPTAEKKEWDDY